MDGKNQHVHSPYMGKNKVKPIPKRSPGKNYIRAWRRKEGLSLERLAERIGTSHATLSRVERGIAALERRAIVDAL